MDSAGEDPQRRGVTKIALHQPRDDLADVADQPSSDVDVGLGGTRLTGRRVAWASGYAPDPADKVLRAWDLGAGKEWVWPLCGDCDKSKPYDRGIHVLRFAPDGSLFAGGLGGVRRWNVETGESQPVLEAPFAGLDASRDGHLLLIWTGELVTTGFPVAAGAGATDGPARRHVPTDHRTR